jgi:hypothetical protein
MKCWGVFSLNDHQVLLEGVNVIIMLMHVVRILDAYLAIAG